ncbi:MAG: hypothetical protein AB7I27_18580 [Bacteriovoracaceae bacterium]
MKIFFLFLALISSQLVRAQGVVVLGVSLDPTEKQYYFPCIGMPYNIVFCGSDTKIEDMRCQRSLNFVPKKSGVEMSCQMSSGSNVVVGFAHGELQVDKTQDAFGSVSVDLNPKFRMEKVGKNFLLKYHE